MKRVPKKVFSLKEEARKLGISWKLARLLHKRLKDDDIAAGTKGRITGATNKTQLTADVEQFVIENNEGKTTKQLQKEIHRRFRKRLSVNRLNVMRSSLRLTRPKK